MAKQYDLTDDSVIVVIGSGAGGGALSEKLAQKGVDVVCLEAGRWLAMSDIVNDPPLMEERMGWQDARYGAPVWLCQTVGPRPCAGQPCAPAYSLTSSAPAPPTAHWTTRRRTHKDVRGLPVPVLEYLLHPNTIAMKRHGASRARELYGALGATDIRDNTDQIGGGCHNMGVARMSPDPNH